MVVSEASSPFRDAVMEEAVPSKQAGENGCLEYTDAGVGSDILVLSQRVRGAEDIANLTQTILRRQEGTNKAREAEVVQLILLLFVTRNTRGGKGEKKLAYDMFLTLWKEYPATAKDLLSLFPLYGYWKDLFLLMQESRKMNDPELVDDLANAVVSLVHSQWKKDLAILAVYEATKTTPMDEDIKAAATSTPSTTSNDAGEGDQQDKKKKMTGPAISLLAKWLPREGKALDKDTGFVKRFTEFLSKQEDGAPTPPTTSTDTAVEKNDHKEGDKPAADAWKSRAKQQYRRQVAKLASYLQLPEVLLAAQRADEIELERVASKATFLYSKAFLNEEKNGALRNNGDDPKRMCLRDKFLDVIVKKGLKGGQVMPHELVQSIMDNPGKISAGMEKALDAQWKNLWEGIVKQVKENAKAEGVDFDPTKMIPLCDVSGSMHGVPMAVAIALGIGISEITHPAMRDMVLTFESDPRWHKLNPSDSLVQKVQSLRAAPWGGSTDFFKAIDRIMTMVEDKNLSREDVPCMIVFSDMQFDQATGSYGHGYGYGYGQATGSCGYGYGYGYGEEQRSDTTDVMNDKIHKRVAKTAKKLGWEGDVEPQPIVYWNLRNCGGHPVDKDTEGTVLLSGFSPSMLKMVMNGESLAVVEVEEVQEDGNVVTKTVRVTPEEVLHKMLDDPLYDPVRRVLGDSREGALLEYEFLAEQEDESMP